MLDVCNKQAYMHGFDCEYITSKINFNMFKRMEISDKIYDGYV